jgi:hypothetical protein
MNGLLIQVGFEHIRSKVLSCDPCGELKSDIYAIVRPGTDKPDEHYCEACAIALLRVLARQEEVFVCQS